MLTVHSPGKPFTLPTEWPEVTLKQYLQLSDCDTTRALLECLASEIDALHALPDDTADFQLMERLAFIKKQPDFLSMAVPQTVLGVVPPTEIGTGTLLQKWDAERWLDELREEHKPEDDEDQPDNERYSLPYTLTAIPLLSIYLAPGLTGERYSGLDHARSVVDRIEALPCTDALPLAGFFLSRLLNQTSSGLITLVEHPSRPAKSRKPGFLLRSWLTLKKTLPLKRLPTLRA